MWAAHAEMPNYIHQKQPAVFAHSPKFCPSNFIHYMTLDVAKELMVLNRKPDLLPWLKWCTYKKFVLVYLGRQPNRKPDLLP